MRVRFLVALVGAAWLVTPALAQARPGQVIAQLKQKQKQLGMQPLPGPAVERFLKMPPEQRQRALAQLPADRRQQIEQNLARLEKLTAEQRTQLEHRFQIFDALPPARKNVIREAIASLRAMGPAQRRAVLEGDDAKLRFNADELQLLRGVVGLPEIEE